MDIYLSCPAGFSYVACGDNPMGWNRVYATAGVPRTDHGGALVGRAIADLLGVIQPRSEDTAGVSYDPFDGALLVEGCESYTLEDFACNVEDVINARVHCQDG